MLSEEKMMEILEAYDLTGSFRATAALCGVDHHTVRRYVATRAAGLDRLRCVERPKVCDPYLAKIDEWVERSGGKVRADVVHRKLCAMGYEASERTTRRVVAELKTNMAVAPTASISPGSPSPACGSSSTTAKGPSSTG